MPKRGIKMEEKSKVKRLIVIVILVITAIVATMTVSYIRGNNESGSAGREVVSTWQNTETGISEVGNESARFGSNDEALGKITGEDDDFTMVADPANFDVKITGFKGNITLLTSTEDVLHQQMKAWMDENEFWDMTEVSYTGKYLRDEASQSTTVYFQISRYPNSPLLAPWNPNTQQYSFTIEWH